jgi:hypothetical protein
VSDVYAIVRSIRENRFPRNRHFEAHATPLSREARRVHRFLRGVERDLLAASSVQIERDGDGFRVSMRFPAVRAVREVVLTAGEHELLVEDARLAARLSPAR